MQKSVNATEVQIRSGINGNKHRTNVTNSTASESESERTINSPQSIVTQQSTSSLGTSRRYNSPDQQWRYIDNVLTVCLQINQTVIVSTTARQRTANKRCCYNARIMY